MDVLEGDDLLAFMGNRTEDIYDYNSNYSCCGGQPCEFDTIQAFEGFFLPLFYSLIFILGLLGNAMVIAVMLRSKEPLPGTDVFIINLAVADVLLVVTLPFWAAQAVHGWIFGDFLCKTLGGVFKINFYASIFFLVCISFDRYLSIVYVIHMYNRRKTKRILFSTLVVWASCVLLTLPDLIFLTTEFDSRQNSTSCSLSFPSGSAKLWKLMLTIFNQLVAFLLPFLIMAYCYICIIVSLLHSKGFQKHKALKVILVVVAVFFLCWTPYHLVQFIDTLIALGVLREDCMWEEKLDIAETVTTSLGFFHCCLNPLLYAFVGVKFRTRFFELLERFGCVSKEYLKRHTRFSSHRRDSSWSESTEASYAGL